MCNSKILFFITNLILFFLSVSILLYCSLILHVYVTSYGINSDVELLLTHSTNDYRDSIYNEFDSRRRETSLLESIRLLFGGDDYNNYNQNNIFTNSRSSIATKNKRKKRQILNNINSIQSPFYSSNINQFQMMNRQYYDIDATKLFSNPNFILILITIFHICITLLLVLIGLFASISLTISNNITSCILRFYFWISFIMICFSVIFGVYLCAALHRNVQYEDRHLLQMYRMYSHNNVRSFATHFIDTMQVHMNCCGPTTPTDFSYAIGSSMALKNSWLPRSCCARNRDELLSNWLHTRSILNSMNGFLGNECNIYNMPEINKRGCLIIVKDSLQTWYGLIILWCLITFICFLITIIAGNKIKDECKYESRN